MKKLSTPEVAKLVGIHPITLERWLATNKVPAPKSMQVGGRVFRNWTAEDIERVRRYKAKHYWEGRGPKPRSKK